MTVFPGTTVETSRLEAGSSRVLFRGIFAAGGITLSQVSVMTGLEPYIIQNWVKRGFLTSPTKRLYSEEQFARVIIINMLRESLHIDTICELIKMIDRAPADREDDLIGNAELYHRYVDMLADTKTDVNDRASVKASAETAVADFEGNGPGAGKQLAGILQVMFYAHTASRMRKLSEEMFSTLR